MRTTYNVLILGASYGSLLATKLAMAGHNVTLVCLPAEVEAINRDGAVVRLPVRGRGPVEIRSKALPGKVSAAGPDSVNPADYDLVGLAMQEPQYRSSGVRELLDEVRVGCADRDAGPDTGRHQGGAHRVITERNVTGTRLKRPRPPARQAQH